MMMPLADKGQRERSKRPAGRYLSPRLIQGFGCLIIVAAFVVWAFTGREPLELVAAAAALIGLGSWQGIRITVQNLDDGETDEADDHDDRAS